MRGKLIVIEGTDCSGKQTQSKLLYDKLRNNGINVSYSSFPVYDSPTGKIIKGPFLGNAEVCNSYFTEGPSNVDSYVSSLYFAADRKYNIGKLIRELDNGNNVILDRYTISNMGHQGSKISDKKKRLELFKWIEKLEYDLLELPKPDICIILHMPTKYIGVLEKNRTVLDGNEKDLNYLKNSHDTYVELSQIYNYKLIECVKNGEIRSINDINNELFEYVKECIWR